MSRSRTSFIRAMFAFAAGGMLLASGSVRSDDRDLLRFETGNPYLFILLDTSGSMSLKVGAGDVRTEGHGDDPDSRLYAAKAALFEVFKDVDDVNFGFGSFNHDWLHVVAKHWLYYYDGALPGNWPLDWPAADPDGLTDDEITEDTDGDGTPDSGDGIPDNDIEGDAMAFGHHIDAAPVGEAGTCGSPLDLDDSTDRAKVNAFPKLHKPDDPRTTTLWVEGGTPRRTYRLLLNRANNKPDNNPNNAYVGDSEIWVDIELDRVSSCAGPAFDMNLTVKFKLKLDPELNEFLMIDNGTPGGGGGNSPIEDTAALWDWHDALDNTSFGSAACGSSSPFSGKGWEGNYDGGVATGVPVFDLLVSNDDPFCNGVPGLCRDLKVNPTQVSPLSRTLDKGDMLPFDWNATNKTGFLQRLAPNYPVGVPDFGVARHLEEDAATGLFVAKGRKPLIARGATPLAKAVNDFRCWYLGAEGPASSKCRNSAYYDQGWHQIACTYDSKWGCRRPFLVIISDGKDTCPGESPAADTAGMNSHSGVQTWALNLGDPGSCQSASQGSLKPMTQNGKGECINVGNKEDLKDTLNDILGQIREETRAFASAAVPSVQATADENIFLSNFTPLRGKSVWDGHLNAFLKPLPLDADGRPDTSTLCSSKPATEQSGCFLWDAGVVVRDQQVPAGTPLGNSPSQRRVFYSRQTTSGKWHATRRLFDPTIDSTADSVRYDLWRGLSLISPSVADGSLADPDETAAQNAANSVIATTLAIKSATLADTGENISYILGDIFHSDPAVIGSPANVGAFAGDISGAACTLAATSTQSYRCFFRKHQFRRRVTAVGSNDGMLHFFNAGIYDATKKKFDNGTGHELFAYMPRGVMPTVRELATGTSHKYGVDGGIIVSDVFIHPGHNGTVDPDAREWRTVLFTGLREGGRAYVAIDITQPDNLTQNGSGEFIPDDGGNYVPSCISSPSNCGSVPFGSAVWEFDDSIYDAVSQQYIALDENNNNEPDLGFTWSKPNLGVIRFCAGISPCSATDPSSLFEERAVAVFGGGMDPDAKTAATPAYGNWLYIVDVETGEALYKHELQGAAPSEPAAVDTDGDGILDRIYIGTTAGYLYRIDLTADAAGDLPAVTSQSVLGLDGSTYSVSRLSAGHWQPRVVFDTLGPTSLTDPTPVRRPLYYRPSVVFVPKLGLYALAFGTGDREDLWSTSGNEGRFYLFVDDTTDVSAAIQESALAPVNATLGGEALVDFLLTRAAGRRGWTLTLDPEERVITDAFALSGVTIFSSFLPMTPLTDQNGNPLSTSGSCSKNFQKDTDNFCSRGGSSRIFVVNTTNANGFLTDASGNSTRYDQVADFVSNPYTEQGQTKNTGSETTGGLTVDQQAVMETLKSLFPSTCRFAHYRIDIKTVAADTSVQHIAAVPVCLIEKNWKEF